MEPIRDYLVRRLREVGANRWPAIAIEISQGMPEGKTVGEPLLRKIAYGDRENPGVLTVQPLIDYFQAVDRGDRDLPSAPEKMVA